MASIRKVKLKKGCTRYRVRIRVKGQYRSRTLSTKAEAEHWASDIERDILREGLSPLGQSRGRTLWSLVDRYCEDVLAKKAKRTQGVQYPRLMYWRGYLGNLPLIEITPPLIAAGKKALDPRGPATVNGYLAVISHAFTVAVKEWRWVECNPVKNVWRLPEPRGRVRFLSDQERAALLFYCRFSTNPCLYPIVVLTLSTGARKNEIRALAWSQVDWRRGKIYLSETKNGERRALPLFGKARELLKSLYEKKEKGEGYCFPSRREKSRPVDFRYAWEAALEKAQIVDFCFHDLRHSAASYLAMDGATLNDIAEILGHKSLEMTRRYSHLTESHTSKLVERMNQTIF